MPPEDAAANQRFQDASGGSTSGASAVASPRRRRGWRDALPHQLPTNPSSQSTLYIRGLSTRQARSLLSLHSLCASPRPHCLRARCSRPELARLRLSLRVWIAQLWVQFEFARSGHSSLHWREWCLPHWDYAANAVRGCRCCFLVILALRGVPISRPTSLEFQIAKPQREGSPGGVSLGSPCRLTRPMAMTIASDAAGE